MSNTSARLATSPWYFIRPNGTEKDASWARIHHSTVFRNGRRERHAGLCRGPARSRAGTVSTTRLAIQSLGVDRTPGVLETGPALRTVDTHVHAWCQTAPEEPCQRADNLTF